MYTAQPLIIPADTLEPGAMLLELSKQFEQLECRPAADFCDLFASLHHESVEIDAQLKTLLEHRELPLLERSWLEFRQNRDE